MEVKIMLNEREKHKMETIIKIVKKEITIKEAMYSLNLSRQQIYRLTKIYKTEGEDGFIHKNRGKVPANKINEAIIEEIKQLYLNEYYDYNFEAFYDELKDNKKYKGKYDISYSTLYNRFLNDDIISPLSHKGTIRLYNEKMKNAIQRK